MRSVKRGRLPSQPRPPPLQQLKERAVGRRRGRVLSLKEARRSYRSCQVERSSKGKHAKHSFSADCIEDVYGFDAAPPCVLDWRLPENVDCTVLNCMEDRGSCASRDAVLLGWPTTTPNTSERLFCRHVAPLWHPVFFRFACSIGLERPFESKIQGGSAL